MGQDRFPIAQDLEDLHRRLVECFDLIEELRHLPTLGSDLSNALAGLHYSVAKVAQDARRLLDTQRGHLD